MSVCLQFANPEPVSAAQHLVVLRFAGLQPHDLGYDNRRGGDLSHVDPNAFDQNEVLLAGSG
ncbi:hypothetical protein [Pseudogemmobacter bohemicus]|uniref:hypothetical protein n=1 Tax=Pseudogemmobacter bohemicus TaxID=2250708 RepID=UPI000DD4448E|nr:hypothetical protein [Pseudogemmobacter bohemicus]